MLILLLVGLQLVHSSRKDYQLEFDWMLSTLSSNIEYGYATWNDGTMITLKETSAPLLKHHEKVAISFVEGINQLSFFFIGAVGQITIDNVVITQPPKTINLLFNVSTYSALRRKAVLGREAIAVHIKKILLRQMLALLISICSRNAT